MDVRVASIILLLVALTAAHGERYVVKKMVKAAPQYQPYSVKSHGKKTQPPATPYNLFFHNLLFLPTLSSQKLPLKSYFLL